MEPSRKPSPLIRHGEAAKLLTSRAVLLACQKAGWLKACIRRKKLTVYNRADVISLENIPANRPHNRKHNASNPLCQIWKGQLNGPRD